MHPADAAWWHMDRPANRMVVTSVLWTDEPLDWDRVREVLRDRFVARYPRFSQRVVELPTLAWWEDLDAFDIEGNVFEHTLDAPADRDALADFVTALLYQRLPMELPLWQIHFIDGFQAGSAIVVRIHHCVADGVALSRVLLSLCDSERPDDAEATVVHGSATQAGGMVLDDLVHPQRVEALLSRALAGTRALGRVVSLAPDVPTCLRGTLTEHKRLLWSNPFPLHDIEDRAGSADATVHEFVLAAVSGALGTYLARSDGQVADIRAIVPVNLRPLEAPLPRSASNRFGLIYLPLPVSVDDPELRLERVRHESRTILRSPDGVLTFDLLDLFGHTAYGVEQAVLDLFASKGSAIATHTAAPDRAMFLAGRRLRGVITWPPESGNVALGISTIRFDGSVVVSLCADRALVDDPEFLLAQIERELSRALSPMSVG
ncbi:MAG TPA: wax ester/triacylglycerol synthase domain-containing protein [Jatrophihabitans sp.]|jgi:WS/DGAT/MGAT family acyltransferase